MNFEKINVKLLDQYKKRVGNRDSFVIIDSSPMNVSQSEDFRKKLYQNDSRLLVCKNSLLNRLIQEKSQKSFDDLKGSRTALVLIDKNPLNVFRSIKDYQSEHKNLKIKHSFFEGVYLNKEGFLKLTKIHSREFLLTKLVISLNSPVQNFHGVLKAVLRNAVGVIRAIKEKKENNQSQ